MKKWIAILLVAMMALSLVACGGSSAKDPAQAIVGTWELSAGEGEEAEQVVAMMLAFGVTMSFEFTKDGKATMTTKMGDDVETEDATYEFKDGKLYMDGSPADCTIDGNKMTIDVDGTKLIFKKK